jgi:GNAT superfamily N-acetyltransferase
MTETVLRPFVKEDADWLVAQHRFLYARDEGFDDSFGDLVSDIVSEFLTDHDPKRERGWIAETEGAPLGSIFCVRLTDTTAKLRLFLVLPEARGTGLGKRLLARCIEFARAAGYSDIELWTHESHRAACALYASSGWTLTDSRTTRSFGQDVVEQSWRIDL